MTTTHHHAAPPASGRTEAQEIHFKSDRNAKLRMYLGLAAIVIWGLAPFYWMVVTAFRDVGYTFDTQPRGRPTSRSTTSARRSPPSVATTSAQPCGTR